MSTTPNYNWPLIENTDFVTNLPADLETLADAIDASFTADEGDLLVGGTSNIFEALPIGAVGTVLTSDGDTAEWAAPATPVLPAEDYALLNTGGTSLNGVNTVTISGISGKKGLFIFIDGVSRSTGNQACNLQFNSDTGNNYNFIGLERAGSSAIVPYASGLTSNIFTVFPGGTTTANVFLQVRGCDGTGFKPFVLNSRTPTTDVPARVFHGSGYYQGTSAISSVTVFGLNNWTAGTVYVYGA
jgi:hypothetical protein